MKAMFRPKGLIVLAGAVLMIFAIYYVFNPKEKNYVAIGDFYAKGHTVDNLYDYGYKDYVKELLSKNKRLRKYEDSYVKEEYTIEKLYDDIKNNDFMIKNSKTISIKKELREADYITITIGLNDLFNELNIINIEELETKDNKDITKAINKCLKNYQVLLTEIKRYTKKDIIIVPYNIYNNVYYKKVYKTIKTWNIKVEKLAKENKVKTIDTFSIYNKENIYPTYKIYKRQAYKIYKLL